MALNDILPYNSPHGGHELVEQYEIATAGFVLGEPVGIDASDGGVAESPTDGSNVENHEIVGIALGPASYNIGGVASTKNPRTGANFAAGDRVPVAVPTNQSTFITSNFTTDGATFDNAAPTAAMIGDEIGLVHIGGDWGVEHGTLDTNATIGRIVDLLDADKNSIQGTTNTLATGTTYYVVFKILAHLGTVSGEADAPGIA